MLSDGELSTGIVTITVSTMLITSGVDIGRRFFTLLAISTTNIAIEKTALIPNKQITSHVRSFIFNAINLNQQFPKFRDVPVVATLLFILTSIKYSIFKEILIISKILNILDRLI